MPRFYSAVLVLFMFFTLQLSAQTGKYDLNFAFSHVDCDASKLYINIQIKAHQSEHKFHLSDQNYRFKFNDILVHNSAFIEQELEVSGYIQSPTGSSLYSTHTLIGSQDSIVSYNIEFIGGQGLFIESNKWTNVGQLGFDIADITGIVHLIYMDENMFPPTFIGEFYNDFRMTADGGMLEGLEINLQDYCGTDSLSDSNTESGQDKPLEEDTTVDIVNPEIEHSVHLFPTLANDFINLRCGDNICGDFRIIDVQGRAVRYWQQGQHAMSSNSFDISDLPSGIYFLQINIKKYNLTRRFIKI